MNQWFIGKPVLCSRLAVCKWDTFADRAIRIFNTLLNACRAVLSYYFCLKDKCNSSKLSFSTTSLEAECSCIQSISSPTFIYCNDPTSTLSLSEAFSHWLALYLILVDKNRVKLAALCYHVQVAFQSICSWSSNLLYQTKESVL